MDIVGILWVTSRKCITVAGASCLKREALDSFRLTELLSTGGIYGVWAQWKANAMHLGYAKPFSFRIEPRPEPKVVSVRHGVTEITLSDGRLVRATLHVKSVKVDPKKPDAIEVCRITLSRKSWRHRTRPFATFTKPSSDTCGGRSKVTCRALTSCRQSSAA